MGKKSQVYLFIDEKGWTAFDFDDKAALEAQKISIGYGSHIGYVIQHLSNRLLVGRG